MAEIVLDHITVDLPVFSPRHRSLKHTLIAFGVGGRLGRDSKDRLVVRALDDVCLRVSEGERVGLIGHNGAGKSTLLRVMAGLCEPTSGRVAASGGISSVLTLSSIIDPEMTGNENIDHALALLGFASNRWSALRADVADFTELGEFLDLPVRSYSDGMRLRLTFALLTMQECDILLLDEAVVVGDARFSAKAEERVKGMGQRSPIVVMASHALTSLRKTCTRLVWLEHGRIREDGPTEQVLARYNREAQKK